MFKNCYHLKQLKLYVNYYNLYLKFYTKLKRILVFKKKSLFLYSMHKYKKQFYPRKMFLFIVHDKAFAIIITKYANNFFEKKNLFL